MDNLSICPQFANLKHPDKDLHVLYPPIFEQKVLDSAVKYKAEDSDIFICTYPKCGTTWMQNIVWLITHYGDPIPTNKKLPDVTSMLEFDGCEFTQSIDNQEFPRIIKTHLPYPFIPQNPNAKYIVITRNPKDALVSYYYHVKGFVEFYLCPGVTLDGIFDEYLKGQVEFGEYFEHVGEWYKKRHQPNVLFLLYEDLKKDPETNILQIARFLGKNYEKSLIKNDQEVLQKIITQSSFKKMTKDSSSVFCRGPRPDELPFIRKGEIGDWRNHFSLEQSAIADKWIEERSKVYGMEELWKDHPEVNGLPFVVNP